MRSKFGQVLQLDEAINTGEYYFKRAKIHRENHWCSKLGLMLMRVRRRNPNAALRATSSTDPMKTLVTEKHTQGLQLRMECNFEDIETKF